MSFKTNIKPIINGKNIFVLTPNGFLVNLDKYNGKILWAMLLASFLIYIPGLIWLVIFDFNWPAEGELLKSALYPFIPGDLLKLVMASLFITGINNWVNKRDKEE